MVTAAQQEPANANPAEVTPDYVRNLTAPTDQFLCRLADNWPNF